MISTCRWTERINYWFSKSIFVICRKTIGDNDIERLQTILAQNPHITKVTIQDKDGLLESSLVPYFATSTRISSLSLEQCSDQAAILVLNNPTIKKLSLFSTSHDPELIEALATNTTLEELKISTKIKEDQFLPMFQRNTTLKRLNIRQFSNIQGLTLALNSNKTLEHIGIYGCMKSRMTVALLNNISNVKSLTFHFLKIKGDTLIHLCAAIQHITSLKLFRCLFHDIEPLEHALKTTTTLTHFEVYGLEYVPNLSQPRSSFTRLLTDNSVLQSFVLRPYRNGFEPEFVPGFWNRAANLDHLGVLITSLADISDMLMSNPPLASLEITFAYGSDFLNIARLLATNTHLGKLKADLSIDKHIADQAAECLQYNTTLMSIKHSYTEIVRHCSLDKLTERNRHNYAQKQGTLVGLVLRYL